jgi:hypothetical protein
VSHCTGDFAPELWGKLVGIYAAAGTRAQVRSREEVARFFKGLDLLEPGISLTHRWRPDDPQGPGPELTDAEVSAWAGVGIKP